MDSARSITSFMRERGPSRTAEYMALFRAVENSQPSARRLFSDPYAIEFDDEALRGFDYP
jgi:O-methyltransferase involved in polyketide biosynthesis